MTAHAATTPASAGSMLGRSRYQLSTNKYTGGNSRFWRSMARAASWTRGPSVMFHLGGWSSCSVPELTAQPNATFRIQGERIPLASIGALYEARNPLVPVAHVTELPEGFVKQTFLQSKLGEGRCSSGWDNYIDKDVLENGDSGHKAWEIGERGACFVV